MDITSQNNEQLNHYSKDDIKILVEENRQLLKVIYLQVEKTRRYILWGRIISIIYLFILVAPIIVAIIYLPPFIQGIVGPYKELLGGTNSGGMNQGIFEQAQGLLNSQSK